MDQIRPTGGPPLRAMYTTMTIVRLVEQALVGLFAENQVPGFVHSYIGEEATAVGVCSALRADDYVTSTHRGHGHIIAKGADLRRFIAEVYGKADGYCQGKGGSMHVADIALGLLGANGIVGAGIPIAAGAALAAKMRGLDRVAVSFFGDGATDTGAFHEALNLAALWSVPAVFVCENNGFAEFTAQSRHQRVARIASRAASYGMPGVTVDGNDVEEVFAAAQAAVSRARSGTGPTLLECATIRRRGHYEGDPESYRDRDDPEWAARDPLVIASSRLRERGELNDAGEARIAADAQALVDDAIAFARASALPQEAVALADVHAGRSEAGW